MNHTVGDTVYADFSRHGRVNVRKGTVLSVSPTGVTRVKFDNGQTRSFLSNGHQRGADTWYAAFLIDQDRYERSLARMREQQAERAAQEAIRALAEIRCITDNKAQLLAAQATVSAAIEAL